MKTPAVLHSKWLQRAEIGIIVLLSLVPLFTSFPYRINIFLSWEGAYRMSEGQVPFKDFGLPMGYMYWVVPAIFFKLFGAQLITLVKAQVFINIISGLAFRHILKSFKLQEGIIFLSVILYVVSFSFFNFWPWYNHTVIVYQMVGLAFLCQYINVSKKPVWLILSALFTFWSFFTKQDGGALALLLCLALLLYRALFQKQWGDLLQFAGWYILIALVHIWPLRGSGFGYWFNHGQPPHVSRLSFREILDEFILGSQWIKFYLLLMLVLLVYKYKKLSAFFHSGRDGLFVLLILGILVEAAIFQVTSYTPPDNNIFFHSFAFAFLAWMLADTLHINFNQWKPLAATLVGILLWWSGVFGKYALRIADRIFPADEVAQKQGSENIINRHTYMISADTTEIPQSDWVFSQVPSFRKIYMPKPTVAGMEKFLDETRNKGYRILNLTELTPLAKEVPFDLPQGQDEALWYHLGVAFFNKDADKLEQRIRSQEYDYILFEEIPTLNNFYPFRTLRVIRDVYTQVDAFPAPRRGDTQGTIYIFSKK